jgi:hypothetical protein
MTNEDRLKAMRWAAATRLALRKGDRWDRRRDQLIVEMIDREFDEHQFDPRDAAGLALAADMAVAFAKIPDAAPLADEGR